MWSGRPPKPRPAHNGTPNSTHPPPPPSLLLHLIRHNPTKQLGILIQDCHPLLMQLPDAPTVLHLQLIGT